MSDPKNISPLLDGFKLGAPISEHNGIVCCPAIKENSNKKYIVKIISVPATQAQLDALLLAGAYKDPADAMEYFRMKGERILAEAEQLKILSKLEGFLPFDGWQMEPITRHRLGYEIYLISTYKRSLEKYIAKTAFTHLEAVNLGLDLCSALSVCRQSGYIYVDLKPSNIYVSEKKEYRIGDLGFMPLNSLRYASLPEQCYSPYTPPELLDPMSPMSLTADTYALGMILYRLYNDGHLPFKGIAPEQAIPSPIHADYEMAEIIMKAISPDPQQRWTDPKDLGKAIASYMQRNSINDIPITPFIPLDVVPEEIDSSSEKKSRHHKSQDSVETADSNTATHVADGPAAVEPVSAPTEEDENSVMSPETSVEVGDAIAQSEDPEVSTPEDTVVSNAEEPSVPEEIPETEPDTSEEAPYLPEQPEIQKQTSDDEGDLSRELTEEVVKIITKADDLIAYQIPESVIYPTEPETDPFAFARDDAEDLDDYDDETSETEESSPVIQPDRKKPAKHFADNSRGRKFRKFMGGLFGTVLVVSGMAGGYWYYQNIYLQSVDAMQITGTQDMITVLIDTAADESRLSVHCIDRNGKRITEAVKGGKVTFQDLEPSTEYTLEVAVSGFHKLTGNTSEVFKTESSTQILTFDAAAGPEAGSVYLEFTVEGNEPDFWNIRYSAEGEDEKRETITKHATTITGLTVGKVYTFTLDGGKSFDLSGNKQLQYVASKLILAENLSAISDNGTDVTIRWNSPGDAVVDNWTVRYYDGYGYDEQLTVTETEAKLNKLTPNVGYTVEVTASGMTQPARMQITPAAPIVYGFNAEEVKHTKLNLKWSFDGTAPDKGWVVLYTVDGSGSQSVECKKAEASITPLIPGATYKFTLQTADGSTVFNDTYTYTTLPAEKFTDNALKLDDLTIDLLKTPSAEKWTYGDIQDSDFTDTFRVGDAASMVIRSASTFYMPSHETKVLYVLRNAYGNVLADLVAEETYYWKNIWQHGDPKIGELNIPMLPALPGEYVLELYFNGKAVAELNFTLTE